MSGVSDFDNYDDLDAVRGFRALVRPFPGAVDAAVRRRVVELAAARGYGARPDGGPAPGGTPVAEPAEDEPPAAEGPLAMVDLRGAGRGRVRRQQRLMVGVAVAAVAAATVGLLAHREGVGEAVDVTGPGAVPLLRPASPPPSPVLLTVSELGALVGRQADHPLVAGDVQLRRVERSRRVDVVGRRGGAELRTDLIERWAAPDRPGRLVIRSVTSPSDGSGLGAIDRPVAADVAFGGVAYRDLRVLPTAGPALEKELAAGLAGRLGVADPVQGLVDLLIEPAVPPAARAGVVDALARRGLAPADTLAEPALQAFELLDGSGRWTVVVDLTSGQVRRWERRRADTGELDASTVVLDTGVVAEVPAP